MAHEPGSLSITALLGNFKYHETNYLAWKRRNKSFHDWLTVDDDADGLETTPFWAGMMLDLAR